MPNPYEEAISRELDAVCPGALEQLGRLDESPGHVGRAVVRILLVRACKCQNVANITLGRSLMQRLPPHWLSTVLTGAVEEVLNLDDEWEYRRLLELLQQLRWEQFEEFRRYGLQSNHPEIREAALDYQP